MLIVSVAMAAEARLLMALMEPVGVVGGRPVFRGRLGGEDALLVLTGMGLVNAAQAVSATLEAFPRASGLINIGCAGAYADSGLAPGQAALASQVVNADLGVAAGGHLHDIAKVGIPVGQDATGAPLYNHLPCDAALNDRLAAGTPNLPRVIFATVGRISGDAATAQATAARWGARIEEMEAAAVAQVAAHYGRPFAALRGVSNIAGQRELDVALGAEAAQRALLAMAEA
ncbi:futalosine nucleosidase [Desulfarculus baarsii DSM 2075]|uniref:Futalosine nucleosidase n=1 Tax=Desulfarculus baarsii (strain ATCC 33931 / DSM 2075 / LMG 7858 / VKM B-1802 / 2st14) TaxID=644282 RepID=E1QJJ4_DESB2|nr:futalosine nucleosidase [Desulfarculus baarsii]ADK85737.1 futalosine nucleosidase [Desulfarculus baarsii DSM 2075]